MSLNNLVIDLTLSGVLSKSVDLAEVSAKVNLPKRIAMADGVAAGKADLIFVDERTIAASGNDDLDLAGVLTDAFGAAITFAKVKAIVIVAVDANTNDVVLKSAPANGFNGPFGASTHSVATGPGGLTVLSAPKAGWPVAGGTGDILRVSNSAAGTPVTYRIAIVGTSA